MPVIPSRFGPATRGWRSVFACIVLVLAVGPVPGSGQTTAASTIVPDTVTLNFVNAEIEGVAKAVSDITGKNFLIDPRVKGVVNIISAKPISRTLVYDVFLSALRLQGYTAVESGGVVTILPEADAKLRQNVVPGGSNLSRGGGDQIQTRVFVLAHESAAQLLPALRPLIAPNNPISVVPNSNTLVITDYASNLQRIARIIASLDVPSGADPVLIPLFHASALDVAQSINRLFPDQTGAQPGGEPSQRIIVATDDRSNSLLVRAADPARLARIRQMVTLLDSPTSAAGNIHVIYLKNAEATKIAETLRGIYSNATAAPRGVASPVASLTAAATAQLPAAQANAYSAPGIIQADAATNSIIITAPEPIYNNLRAVVEKLDARRAQVYVEALIAEVTADKAAEFGIQWQDLAGLRSGPASAFGGTNFGNAGQNIIGIAQNPVSAGRGLNIGVLKGTVTLGGAQILNLGLLIRALESGSNANILSTPTLLTLDNEEAKIVIGQNVPFVTGQYAVSAAATTPTPFQTIERKDVGLTLRVKPQITQGGTVRLQIFQEVSSVDSSSNISGLITNKRSVESTVLVEDGQIVVIGGLIQDTFRDGQEKVPGLGDIPLIGNLFKYSSRLRTKTNLMVFLRPTLLRHAQSADSITNDRYDYILGEQARAHVPSAILPDFGAASLPLRLSREPMGSNLPPSSTPAPALTPAPAPAPPPAPK